MKKLTAVVLLFALLVTACSTKEPGKLADSVTNPSESTNAYTNLDAAALLDSMGKYEGVSVVSTVNEEGTPNIGIFVPGVLPPDYLAFGLAENATRENILRTGTAVMCYDVVNTAAENKADRHKGAIVKLKLEKDADTLKRLEEESGMDLSKRLVMKMEAVYPVG